MPALKPKPIAKYVACKAGTLHAVSQDVLALTVTGLLRYWFASPSISTGMVALNSSVW